MSVFDANGLHLGSVQRVGATSFSLLTSAGPIWLRREAVSAVEGTNVVLQCAAAQLDSYRRTGTPRAGGAAE